MATDNKKNRKKTAADELADTNDDERPTKVIRLYPFPVMQR